MNLQSIFEEQLPGMENYIIEEGIFKVSPAIAFFAFKNDVIEKAKKTANKGKDLVLGTTGKALSKVETIKAKTLGQSGFKDSDTVYKFTKEQKEVMAYLYKKYGAEIVNKISKFRTEIMAPYQIIKRNVEKNRSLTNREVFGMTKEEYYKYRESGRKKIEKRGTYFKDSEELRKGTVSSRDALEKAEKALSDFKSGKIIDLSATHVDKILDSLGIGTDKLYGWTERELSMTFSEINRLKELLNNPKRSLDGERVLVAGRAGTQKERYEYRSDIKRRISNLEEKGYNAVEGKQEGNKGNTNTKRKGAPFKQAYNIFLLRKENIKKMRENNSYSSFRETYEKVLKDAIEDAKKTHKEKLANYTGLKSTIELNKFEKKIWGKKILGTNYSGDINDWYLKIKPDKFFKTEYFEKSDKIIKAEKDIDAATKRFERDLKKTMDDNDLNLCKKYRLFNNFITVKQLKNPSNLFKSSDDLKREVKNIKTNFSDEDFENALHSAMNKEYNSIRELEDEQEKIKNMSRGKELNNSVKKELENFLDRINPKGNSNITKISRQKFNDELKRILNKEYTGKIDAENDLKKLEDTIKDFREVNGEEELKQFLHDIDSAKEKINSFLDYKEDEK